MSDLGRWILRYAQNFRIAGSPKPEPATGRHITTAFNAVGELAFLNRNCSPQEWSQGLLRETDTQSSPSREGPSSALSIDEANRLYPREWVLLKVTVTNEEGIITHGEVLDHGPHRGKLNRTVKRLHATEPDAHILIFLGGTRYAAGQELRRALSELAEHEIDARR